MSRTFIYDPSIMPAAKFHSAAAKIQTLARSKRAKQTTATLRSKRIRDRTAYNSYLTSHTQDNDQGLQGWAGLELLYNFLPILSIERGVDVSEGRLASAPTPDDLCLGIHLEVSSLKAVWCGENAPGFKQL